MIDFKSGADFSQVLGADIVPALFTNSDKAVDRDVLAISFNIAPSSAVSEHRLRFQTAISIVVHFFGNNPCQKLTRTGDSRSYRIAARTSFHKSMIKNSWTSYLVALLCIPRYPCFSNRINPRKSPIIQFRIGWALFKDGFTDKIAIDAKLSASASEKESKCLYFVDGSHFPCRE